MLSEYQPRLMNCIKITPWFSDFDVNTLFTVQFFDDAVRETELHTR